MQFTSQASGNYLLVCTVTLPAAGLAQHVSMLCQWCAPALEQTAFCQLQADWQDSCDTKEVDLAPAAATEVPSALDCSVIGSASAVLLQGICEPLAVTVASSVIACHCKTLIGNERL